MTQEEIIEIIEANSDLTYEEMKKEAIIAGIKIPDFNDAWNEYLRKTRKPSVSILWIKIYVVILSIIILFGFETAFWRFVIKTKNTVFAENFGGLAILAAVILTLHLASRLSGSQKNIITTTKVSIFLFIVAHIAHLATTASSSVYYIIILFGGVIIGFIVLYTLIETYDLDLLRVMMLIILEVFFMGIVILMTTGLTGLKNYYSPKQILNTNELESVSAVNIAEEALKTPDQPTAPTEQQ
jgi:hypothetical protein